MFLNVRAPGCGTRFGADWDAQCASLSVLLTGTAAVYTRLSEAAVLLSVVRTPTVSPLSGVTMSRSWVFQRAATSPLSAIQV